MKQIDSITMNTNEEQAVVFDPEEFEELEKDAVDLESQLEGLKTAEVSSASAAKLVVFVKTAQEEDDLITGSEENRWKELIVNEEPEDEKPDTDRCCTLQ